MTTPTTLYGVTKEMFAEYERLRLSGTVNMFGARPYLDWDRTPFLAVLKHYSEMAAAWPDVLEQAGRTA